MVDQALLVDAGLSEGLWVLIGSIAGLVVAAACVLGLAQRRNVPAGACVAAVGVLHGAGVLASSWALGAAEPVLGVLSAGVVRLTGALAMVPLAVTLLGGLAFVGARDAPRDWRAAAAIWGLCALTAAATLVEGWQGSNPVFGVFRAAICMGLGSLTAAACSGASERSGATAGVAAGVAFAVVVAALEASNGGMIAAFALHATLESVPDVALRPEAVGKMYGRIAPGAVWAWVAVGMAVLTALASAFVAHRRAGSVPSIGSALLWLPLVACAPWLGMPDAGDVERASTATGEP